MANEVNKAKAKEAKRIADLKERVERIRLKNAKREEAAQAKREKQDEDRHQAQINATVREQESREELDTKRHTDLESVAADNIRFNDEQFKSAKKAEARDIINKGKILKSTKESIAQEQKVQKELFEKILADIKLTVPEDQQAEKIKELTDSVGSVSGGDTQAGVLKVAEQFSDVLSKDTTEALGKMSKDGGKGDDKVAKLKAKEAKQDERKKKFSFKENVDKVKEVGKNAFDKIKGMLIKGALILALTQVGKFLNSDAWVKIKAFIIDTLIPLLANVWDNVIKPAFLAIGDIFSIIGDLIAGDFDSAMATFKDNFMFIIPVLLIAIGVIVSMLFAAASALGPVVLIGIAIGLAIAGLVLIFKKLQDALGIDSFGDMLRVAAGYIKDMFAKLINALLFIPKMILGGIGTVLDKIPMDWARSAAAKLKSFSGARMSTDNASKAIAQGQANTKISRAKAEADKAAEEAADAKAGGGGAVMANNNNTTNVNQSSTTQVMPSPMPEVTKFGNYGEVQLA